MEKITNVTKKHDYYVRNKEKMNQLARERYHRKKSDPEFYKNMLVRNQESYYKKIKGSVSPASAEEEELYFENIRKYVAYTREMDKDRKKNEYSYEQLHEMFFSE